jgi:membrane peptidoglycan carboxypeptidase
MLLALLKVPSLYDQDLLDLTVKSSLDYRAQKEVTDILRKLSEAEFTKAAGLIGPHMLGNRNPANVIYSFTLYERTPAQIFSGYKLTISTSLSILMKA